MPAQHANSSARSATTPNCAPLAGPVEGLSEDAPVLAPSPPATPAIPATKALAVQHAVSPRHLRHGQSIAAHEIGDRIGSRQHHACEHRRGRNLEQNSRRPLGPGFRQRSQADRQCGHVYPEQQRRSHFQSRKRHEPNGDYPGRANHKRNQESRPASLPSPGSKLACRRGNHRRRKSSEMKVRSAQQSRRLWPAERPDPQPRRQEPAPRPPPDRSLRSAVPTPMPGGRVRR